MNDPLVVDAVKNIVSLISSGDFDALERQGLLGPGTVQEYRDALSRYLRDREVLVEPPRSAFDDFDVCETADSKKRRLDFDLWTDRGRSDLTAQIYVQEGPPGVFRFMLYDLRVL